MEKHFKRVHFPKETGSSNVTVSVPKTRFKCENCDEEFSTKLDFKKHKDPQKLLCKKCQEDKKKFICDNKCELIKHVRKMHQRDLMLKKQNIIEQKRQEKLQKRQQQLQQQQQTLVKNFTPRHQCLKCQKVFKDNNFLELHMKEEHSNKEIKKEMVEITGSARRFGTTKITPIAPKTRSSQTPTRAAGVVTKQEPPPAKKQRTTVPEEVVGPPEPLQHFYYKTFTAEELIRLGIFNELSASTFVPPPLVETITGDLDLPEENQKITTEETREQEYIEPPNTLEGVFILGL